MAGLPPAALRPGMRLFGRWAFSPRVDWDTSRRRVQLGTMLPPPPRGTQVRPTTLGGVPCDEVRPPGSSEDPLLLYFNGGGYVVGSPRTVRGMAARLAQAMGSRAVVAGYRLAPEHPFPAALDDARAVWHALTREQGVAPHRIAVAGDSAGAGLALALAVALRDAGEPLPGALGLICPWLDVSPARAATRPPAPREPLLSEGLLRRFSAAYLAGGADAADPLVSPLHADMAGLPPMVIQTGADDLIRGDGQELAAKARAAGVAVDHEDLHGLWHDAQLSAALLAGEAGQTLARLGAAVRARLDA